MDAQARVDHSTKALYKWDRLLTEADVKASNLNTPDGQQKEYVYGNSWFRKNQSSVTRSHCWFTYILLLVPVHQQINGLSRPIFGMVVKSISRLPLISAEATKTSHFTPSVNTRWWTSCRSGGEGCIGNTSTSTWAAALAYRYESRGPKFMTCCLVEKKTHQFGTSIPDRIDNSIDENVISTILHMLSTFNLSLDSWQTARHLFTRSSVSGATFGSRLDALTNDWCSFTCFSSQGDHVFYRASTRAELSITDGKDYHS